MTDNEIIDCEVSAWDSYQENLKFFSSETLKHVCVGGFSIAQQALTNLFFFLLFTDVEKKKIGHTCGTQYCGPVRVENFSFLISIIK